MIDVVLLSAAQRRFFPPKAARRNTKPLPAQDRQPLIWAEGCQALRTRMSRVVPCLGRLRRRPVGRRDRGAARRDGEAHAGDRPGGARRPLARAAGRVRRAPDQSSQRAMPWQNLKAVAQVVGIVRELDRHHGFFPAERRSLGGPRPMTLSEAEAEEPLALLADGLGTAPQSLEKARSRPENNRDPAASDEAFALPIELDEYWSDQLHPSPLPQFPDQARGRDGARGRRQTFSRLREKVAGGSRPDEGLRHGSINSHPPLVAGPAQDACAPLTPPIERPEMAPQEPGKAQLEPEDDRAPASSDQAFTPEASPAAMADPAPPADDPPADPIFPARRAEVAPLAHGRDPTD
jgi:hypothetical protein